MFFIISCAIRWAPWRNSSSARPRSSAASPTADPGAPLGVLHRLAGLVELVALAADAELADVALQPAEAVAELALALAELPRGALLALARLPGPRRAGPAVGPGLAGLADRAVRVGPAAGRAARPAGPADGPGAALLALLVLPAQLAEGLVHELLLLADQIAELSIIFIICWLWRALLFAHAAGLEPLEHVAQLRQHLLGLIARAVPGHLLDVAHHAIEVLLAQHLTVRVEAFRHVRHVAGLLLKLLHVVVERLPQLLHELLDLLLGGTVLERLGELVLRVAQRAFGVGEVAVLDPQRDVPELVDGAFKVARLTGRCRRCTTERRPR